MIEIAPNQRLLARHFTAEFPKPLQDCPASERVLRLLRKEDSPGFAPDEAIKAAVRNLLRLGGFKPTGRSKPASEYLEKAFQEGYLNPINAAVDVCNAVSLHSGLPISVIDLDLAQAPYEVKIVPEKVSYVFNPSGQELDLQGLVCFWDAQGPCGSPVKDSQRTKTHAETRRTLVLIWGSQEIPDRVDAAELLYRQLLQDCGAKLAK